MKLVHTTTNDVLIVTDETVIALNKIGFLSEKVNLQEIKKFVVSCLPEKLIPGESLGSEMIFMLWDLEPDLIRQIVPDLKFINGIVIDLLNFLSVSPTAIDLIVFLIPFGRPELVGSLLKYSAYLQTCHLEKLKMVAPLQHQEMISNMINTRKNAIRNGIRLAVS